MLTLFFIFRIYSLTQTSDDKNCLIKTVSTAKHMLMDEEACLENVLIVDEKSFFQYFCDYDI